MKAAIYNPYLDTLGGGERYTASLASLLLDQGYQVDIEWQDKLIGGKIENRFGINLDNANIVESIKRGEGYDFCFWISDGSLPLLYARKNILHFQVPFHHVNGKSLINRMKLYRIKTVVCNSYFTKEVIDREFGVKSKVIYPPIDVETVVPRKKKNYILYVGRFSGLKQAKNHRVLISAFKKLVDGGLKKWKLVFAGGIEVGSEKYLSRLKTSAEKYPVIYYESPPYEKIVKLYGEAKIFWSAAGYRVDEKKNPEKAEHFGMSLVEAMAGGCLPLVYRAGGHLEIIDDSVDGFFWEKPSELLTTTKKLIRSGLSIYPELVRKKSLKYDKVQFTKQWLKILE